MPMSMSPVFPAIRSLVQSIDPLDSLESQHQAETLAWLSTTADVFRRVRMPSMPAKHLVSYFLPTDPATHAVLLGQHITSGLWLPPGGHVDPGEHPAATVRRECREELGVDAEFLSQIGARPLFLTVTDTSGPQNRHTDVSLWFVVTLGQDQAIAPDPGEYLTVRWWTPAEVRSASAEQLDPHMGRMLDKLGALLDVS